MRLLVKWLILALAIALTAELFPGIEVDGGFAALLWIAFVFGLVNAVLGPILRFLAIPLIAVTLGLFAFVVNALLFLLVDLLADQLDIDGFLPALGGAFVISVVTALLEFFLDTNE